jgi:outer membrane protein assembly factor BamB
VLIAVLWLLLTVPGWLAPATMMQFYAMFFGPMVIGALLVIWWLFLSRIRWTERFLVLYAFAATGAATFPYWHHTLTDDESKGFGVLVIYAFPVTVTAWVGWLAITPFLRWPVRCVGLLMVFVMSWGAYTLVRFEGVEGDMSSTFKYRGTPTAEEKYLAKRSAEKNATTQAADSNSPRTLQASDWPGFRGPNRDGRLTGVRLNTDWQKHPPREL